MRDPFTDMLGDFDNLKGIVDAYKRKSEPEFHETTERVMQVLLGARGMWITRDGIVKRTGLSERAVLAALDALKSKGRVKNGTSRDGVQVWRRT